MNKIDYNAIPVLDIREALCKKSLELRKSYVTKEKIKTA